MQNCLDLTVALSALEIAVEVLRFFYSPTSQLQQQDSNELPSTIKTEPKSFHHMRLTSRFVCVKLFYFSSQVLMYGVFQGRVNVVCLLIWLLCFFCVAIVIVMHCWAMALLPVLAPACQAANILSKIDLAPCRHPHHRTITLWLLSTVAVKEQYKQGTISTTLLLQ